MNEKENSDLDKNKILKVVFSDANYNKALKGYLLEETDFFYKFKTLSGDIAIIGKKHIISITTAMEDR